MIQVLALIALAQVLPPVRGELNPLVNQGNISRTICYPRWTTRVRPPARYTSWLKTRQLLGFGILGFDSLYEEDHRVPLELGGAPRDEDNLWPEPWFGKYNAHDKDRLENAVRRDVCVKRLTLEQGRAIFLGDFWKEYKRRFE